MDNALAGCTNLVTMPHAMWSDNLGVCQHPATRKGWIMLLVETLHEMKSGLLRAREIGTIKA